MVKFGIVTPYGLFNYGNRLQNWAVDVNLRSRGLDPLTLILRKSYARSVPLDLGRNAAHVLRLKKLPSGRYRRFLDFDSPLKKQRILSPRHLRGVMRNVDGIVIGSDQIWNPHQVDFNGAEFAAGAAAESTISLSASFGIDTYPVERAQSTAEALRDIAHLSVRERAGQEIVKDLTGRHAEVLVDPTLSLEKSVWDRRASKSRVPARSYGFVYMLGRYADSVRVEIDDWILGDANEVVRLYDMTSETYFTSGPQDFIGLIAESNVVVTDSYHAVIFGILFGKRIILVERKGKPYSMRSRFSTLSDLLGVTFEPTTDIVGADASEVVVPEHQDVFAARRTEFHTFLDRAVEEVLGTTGRGARPL